VKNYTGCEAVGDSKAVGAARSLAALPYPHRCRVDTRHRWVSDPIRSDPPSVRLKGSIRPAQSCLKQRPRAFEYNLRADVLAPALRRASEGKRGCEGNCRWSRGSDPRLLRLTLDKLPDHASGERPRGSKARPYLKARLADSNVFVLPCHRD
jgi:hypothetical protein